MKLSRRALLFFVVLFFVLALATSALQSFWIDRLVIERSSARMETLIRVAWSVLETDFEMLQSGLLFVAREHENAPEAERATLLERHRSELGLDLLVVEDGDGAFVESLTRGSGAERGYALVEKEKLVSRSVVPEKLCESDEERGLLLFATQPLPGDAGESLLVAGRLLNCANGIVDEIQRVLFEDQLYQGRPVGTATIFQGRLRIATTVLDDQGDRARGTLVSDEVAAQVLGRGEAWTGRAWVVNDWYLSRYEPIRAADGSVLGMLYIGELERLYLDEKKRALTEMLVVLVALVGSAALIGWLVSRPHIRQIVQLEKATARFAAGQLGTRAPELSSRDELARLARAFNSMAEDIEREHERVLEQSQRIEQLNRNYLDMLGFVTHEFRSTIGSALFNAQLLEEGGFGEMSDEGREGVQLVKSALEHLNSITRNYLQLSQIEAGELVVDRAEVNVVRDALRPVLEALGTQLEARDVRVEVEVDESLVVPADATLLRVVYENLIGNAAKYGGTGSRIVIGGREVGSNAELFVWNDGDAIDEEHLPSLFGKFRRYDTDTLEGRQGSGLGLFIVKKIVEGHGGKVWVDSAPGEGTRFTFTIAT